MLWTGVWLLPILLLFSAGDAHQAALEKTRLDELRKTADELRGIIVRNDITSLLQYVEVQMDDDKERFEQVKRDLGNPNSWLYGRLFDSEVFRRHVASNPAFPNPMSVRTYFLRARDLGIDVSFYREGSKKKLEWGWVVYYSSNFPRPEWPAATFFYKDGKWWIRSFFQDRP